MSLIARIFVFTSLVLALGCSGPALKGSTTLRLQDRLDEDCLKSALKDQPGVSRVWRSDPIHFRFTPPGADEKLEFELHQSRIGLSGGWLLTIGGKVKDRGADAPALASDLGRKVAALRDAVAQACGAVVLPEP